MLLISTGRASYAAPFFDTQGILVLLSFGSLAVFHAFAAPTEIV
jgi:hypothetical protein